MPFVDLEGQRLFYRNCQPPAAKALGTVLFLHGLGADSRSWLLQLDPLAGAGWHCLAIDFPGHGRSPYDKPISRPGQLADLAAAFLCQLKQGPAHIVGLSLGGLAALELGINHPESVRSLVIVNTAAHLRPRRLRVALYYGLRMVMTLSLGKRVQAYLVARRIFPLDSQAWYRKELREQINRADPRAYRRALLSLARFDVSAKLASVSAPALVVTGAQDTTIPPGRQADLAASLKTSRQEIISGAGHAVPIEKPALFNRLLLSFIGSVNP